MNWVTIAGLSRAAVFAALYNAAQVQGAGVHQYDPAPMSEELAERLLARQEYWSYAKGRVMYVTIDNDEKVEVGGYDMDNGEGRAAAVIASLRETGDVNNPIIQTFHKTGSEKAVADVLQNLGYVPESGTRLEDEDVVHVVGMGFPPGTGAMALRVMATLKSS